MKAYKVELLILDFDNLGPDGVLQAIENVRYSNDCIAPSVMEIEGRDIGEWSDDGPLNRRDLAKAEYQRLFGADSDGDALRLAVKLGMTLRLSPEGYAVAQHRLASYVEETNAIDANDAARRAINRAAAEIGKHSAPSDSGREV